MLDCWGELLARLTRLNTGGTKSLLSKLYSKTSSTSTATNTLLFTSTATTTPLLLLQNVGGRERVA